jgi:hypothetical protein
MIRARSSIDATRRSGDQERAPLSGVPTDLPPRPDSAIRVDGAPGIQGGERVKSPPAPLCNSTTSLRLDQTGQRVERVRNILQIAGVLCLGPLCWLIGGIVVAINGGGEHTENMIALLTTGGVAIGGVLLLLVSSLVGRRTSDWWHPRMRETAPTGYPGESLSVKPTRRKSASPLDSEREAKRRYRMAKRVRRQIREAQIFDRRLDGGGTLLTEPIILLHGRPRGDFAIFDQEGNQLGSAVRMQDPTSESPGSAWISEVRDNQGRSVVTIRLAARRRWPKSVPTKTGTYAVCTPDGSEIANIGQLTKHASRTVTVGATDAIARLDGGPAMTVSDAEGRVVAHITSNRPWYVLNYKAPADEPLRRLVLAASIVWDDAGPESTS